MVIGEFGEILFWGDISKLLQKERELYAKYTPDTSKDGARMFLAEKQEFILQNIPTKNEFLKRISYYEKHGKPVWIAGRNPCCDDLSISQLQKAYKNESRGAERAETVEGGIASWAKHIEFYSDSIILNRDNHILELTTGAGFGTVSVARSMRDRDFYVGVDIDCKCAKNAEGIMRHYGRSGVGIATSLWNLPFDDETFNVVCSHLGIDECREVPTILSEAVRVLEPGGRIVLTLNDSGYRRIKYYSDIYNIGEDEALDCLRRVRKYADRTQLEEIMEGLNMTLTDFRQFDGRYVVVYTK